MRSSGQLHALTGLPSLLGKHRQPNTHPLPSLTPMCCLTALHGHIIASTCT
jgi:hypothetical protein